MSATPVEELPFSELMRTAKQLVQSQWCGEANSVIAECFQRLQTELQQQFRNADERVRQVQVGAQLTTTSLQNANNALLLMANKKFVQSRIATKADDDAYHVTKSQDDRTRQTDEDDTSDVSGDSGSDSGADAATAAEHPHQPWEEGERAAVLALRQQLVDRGDEVLDQRLIPIVLPGDERGEVEAEHNMCMRRTRYRKRRFFAFIGSAEFTDDPYSGLRSAMTGRAVAREVKLSAECDSDGEGGEDEWVSDDEEAVNGTRCVDAARSAASQQSTYKLPIPLLLPPTPAPAASVSSGPTSADSVEKTQRDVLPPPKFKTSTQQSTLSPAGVSAAKASRNNVALTSRTSKAKPLFGSSSESSSSSSARSACAEPPVTGNRGTEAVPQSSLPPRSVLPRTAADQGLRSQSNKKNLFGSSSSSLSSTTSSDAIPPSRTVVPPPVAAPKAVAKGGSVVPTRQTQLFESSTASSTSSTTLSEATTSARRGAPVFAPGGADKTPAVATEPSAPAAHQTSEDVDVHYARSLSSSHSAHSELPSTTQSRPPVTGTNARASIRILPTFLSPLPEGVPRPTPSPHSAASRHNSTSDDESGFFVAPPPPPPQVFMDIMPPPMNALPSSPPTSATPPAAPYAVPVATNHPTALLPPRGANVLSTSSEDDD